MGREGGREGIPYRGCEWGSTDRESEKKKKNKKKVGVIGKRSSFVVLS